MNLAAAIAVALTALRVNALRSFLAMLGVIIGVGSVIVMISISQGAKSAVEEQIAGLGANMLMIRPGSANSGGRRGGAGSGTPFSDADADALRNELPVITAASGMVQGSVTAVTDGVNWPTQIQGVHPDYFEIRDWFVSEGRAFTVTEVNASTRVAVIGQSIVEEVFPNSNPLGATLRLNNVPFEVVGILSERGQSSFGQDQDDVIFAPITTVRNRVTGYSRAGVRDPVQVLWVEVATGEDMAIAIAELEDFLRLRREIEVSAEDDFAVLNFADFIRARNETESQLGLLLAATALISLIVGGIGIMNIMLVSVTERTREIGLRLAIGAKQADIRNQFLIEAIVLCMTGGVIGLAAGMAGARIVESMGEFPVSIDPMIALVAIGASGFVGILFGFYPAHRASRLNPIDALRHE